MTNCEHIWLMIDRKLTLVPIISEQCQLCGLVRECHEEPDGTREYEYKGYHDIVRIKGRNA